LNQKYGIPISENPDYWDNITGNQFAEARKAMENLYAKQKSDVLAIQDPKNIRSRFAAFDPMKKDSANLLASILLGTAIAPQMMGDKK
jgi:hypothetical protein